jgi:pyruvate dehydrogenase (quinone)
VKNIGDFLIDRLHAWGVRRIFGYPGDGINGIVAAIDRFQKASGASAMEFVQVRHEEQAAFMATAHAKFTGQLGVCLATSGPGAVHLLNGLYDAKNDHMPVLAITGQTATSALGSEYQQEVDLPSLFKDVASEYSATIVAPAQVRHCIDRAVRSAIAARTVTALFFPKDLQEEEAIVEPPHRMNFNASSTGFSRARLIPHEEDLRRTAELLNAGSKVAMLVGAGAEGAESELVAVADALQAGCAKALLGKAVLPDDFPWVTGTLGLLGTRASSDMMSECDTLLMVGTNYPYAQFLPRGDKVRGVQIDIAGERLGIRFPMEINLQGDGRSTLAALLPYLERKTDTSWREKIAKDREQEDEVHKSRAAVEGNGVNPAVVFRELNARLPDHCILTADAGTSTNWAARHLEMRRGMKFSLSGGLATMGSAVPYAIAAKFAFPERVAIALTGDGAMQMNGINGLITVARYWKQWADPRLIFYVANNEDLNQVTWEMRVQTGVPKFPQSQDLPAFPYATYARMLGFKGIRVERAEDVGAAWDAVLRADRPAVLEVAVDAEISMLPPHVTPELAKTFAATALKGDPEEGPMIVQSVKGILAGMFPGSHRGDESGDGR